MCGDASLDTGVGYTGLVGQINGATVVWRSMPQLDACAEDVPRTDDAPTRSSFASIEDGVARQRFRNMRPKACPPDERLLEVASNEWEHLVQRWEILASDQHLNDAVFRQPLTFPCQVTRS